MTQLRLAPSDDYHLSSVFTTCKASCIAETEIAIQQVLFTPVMPTQLFGDFRALVDNLEANMTTTCCFSSTNIHIVNRIFTTKEGPFPTISDVFVSYLTYDLSEVCMVWI